MTMATTQPGRVIHDEGVSFCEPEPGGERNRLRVTTDEQAAGG